MTSRAPATLVWLWQQVEALPDYPSATFSGIVPDAAHLDRGGYHVSIEDLIIHGNAGDYSNRRPLDKIPPVTRPDGEEQSAALDISLSKPDMVRLYGRVKRVFDDVTDPRHKWLNYWNVWDGNPDHLPARFNFQSHTVGTTDRSHEWHEHEDRPRAYVDLALNEANCWTAARAALSVWKGETAAQWLASEGGDEDMQADERAWLKAVYQATFYGGVSCGDVVAPSNGRDPANSLVNKLDWANERMPPPVDVDALAAAIAAALPPVTCDCGEATAPTIEQISATIRAQLDVTKLSGMI